MLYVFVIFRNIQTWNIYNISLKSFPQIFLGREARFVMIIPPLTWVHLSVGLCFADKLSAQTFPSSEAEKANHSRSPQHSGDK